MGPWAGGAGVLLLGLEGVPCLPLQSLPALLELTSPRSLTPTDRSRLVSNARSCLEQPLSPPCHGLNVSLSNAHVESLTSLPQNVTKFGDRAFKEVIWVKRGPLGRP